MKKALLYRGASGLNDKIDAVRVPYSSESGVTGLTRADNVVFDLTGAVSRRDGYTILSSGDHHSIFSCGDYGLCVKDGYLNLISGGEQSTALVFVSNARMSYARWFDGSKDVAFFSNGSTVGMIRDKGYLAWTVPAYVGVPSTKSKVKSFLPSIPPGHILGIFNGRMYIAKDNLIYPSEQLAFSWFDFEKAYIFDSRITMMRFMATGLYVSTRSEIFFLPGSDIEDFGRIKIYDGMAVEGTDIPVPATTAGAQSRGDVFFFAVSGRGICSADETGTIVNHTENFIDFPESDMGTAYITGNKQYVVTLQ